MSRRKKLRSVVDLPREMHIFLLERWAELMEPIRSQFVEAGLVGKKFTEKAPDMTLKRLNYSFAPDGTWMFDWESNVDTGDTIITYPDNDTGYRSLADLDYDFTGAFIRGVFRIEPSAEDALRMYPMMPDMQKFFRKAIRDTEKRYNLELPKYRRSWIKKLFKRKASYMNLPPPAEKVIELD
nr:hypothetical protein [Candidatus Freyarchaeota archaeon]